MVYIASEKCQGVQSWEMQGENDLYKKCFPPSPPLDAAYRFFRSRCEERSASRRGIAALNQKKRRQLHERIARVSLIKFKGGPQNIMLFIIVTYIYILDPRHVEVHLL